MLAENTDIDARTRWKDAITILQDDARYKNVDDARDREDLFQEFVLELEKKEKEDLRRSREAAIAQFASLVRAQAAAGKVTRTSLWADCKKLFVDAICKVELRAMDDTDFRRTFQSVTAELEEAHRAAEKQRLHDLERNLAACKDQFRVFLEQLARPLERQEHQDQRAQVPFLTINSRWREFFKSEQVVGAAPYTSMLALFFPGGVSIEDATEKEKDRARENCAAACREVFDVVQSKLLDQFRADKRLIKSALRKWRVSHDSTFAEFNDILRGFAKLNGSTSSTENAANGAGESAEGAEEGEEPDDERERAQVASLLTERPAAAAVVFEDMLEKAQVEHEEDLRYARKMEAKFAALLADTFHRAEDAAIPWDEAKKSLQQRSVYDELGKSDRRRLFAEHMARLASGTAAPPAASGAADRKDRDRDHSSSRRPAHENGNGRDHSQSRKVCFVFKILDLISIGYNLSFVLLRIN
jgi:hypothetical protein